MNKYIKSILFGQTNFYALLATLSSGMLLSIPFGFEAALIPLVLFMAGDALAVLFLSQSIAYREKINKKDRAKGREAIRKKLLVAIEDRKKKRGMLDAYYRMQERVASLYEIAEKDDNQMTERDVERLDDATIDYLRMVLASSVIEERNKSVSTRDIKRRIRNIDGEIKRLEGSNVTPLNKAKHSYEQLIQRQQRMGHNKVAIDAMLTSMPDQLDEIYQSILLAPGSSDSNRKLSEYVDRFTLSQDIEAELEQDFREINFDVGIDQSAKQVAKKRQAQRQRQG